MNVEQRWPDLARRQAAIRAEAEARVVERRWSSSTATAPMRCWTSSGFQSGARVRRGGVQAAWRSRSIGAMALVVRSAGPASSAVTDSKTHRRAFRGRPTSDGRTRTGRTSRSTASGSCTTVGSSPSTPRSEPRRSCRRCSSTGRVRPTPGALESCGVRIRPGRDDACFKFLARAAKRLNADYRLNLPRTDAFVVFAIDPEIVDQCVPPDTVERLRRAGLLVVDP